MLQFIQRKRYQTTKMTKTQNNQNRQSKKKRKRQTIVTHAKIKNKTKFSGLYARQPSDIQHIMSTIEQN